MSDDLKPVTFLDKIEVEFHDTKQWFIEAFGDTSAVHNLLSDLKMKVLSHVADHFGEDSEVGKQEAAPAQTVLDLSSSSTADPSDQTPPV